MCLKGLHQSMAVKFILDPSGSSIHLYKIDVFFKLYIYYNFFQEYLLSCKKFLIVLYLLKLMSIKTWQYTSKGISHTVKFNVQDFVSLNPEWEIDTH